MTKYVIIGMGAAGIAAAEAIRSLDRSGSIQLINQEQDGYYSRPALAYYLSKEVNIKSIFPFQQSDFTRLGLARITARAERIDTLDRRVELNSGPPIAYDRLLLAPGAEAVQPDLPGISLDGVVYLDSLSSTNQILNLARRGKKAVVIGGGITALELVEGLAARKLEVHFFLRGELYWNRVLDSQESAVILKRLTDHGVIIHKNTSIAEVRGRKGKVVEVLTTENDLFKTDLVGVAIGVRPRTGLAHHSGIECDRGILVDQYLNTSQQEIYAAGDAAEVFDSDTGSRIVDSLWPIARHQGRCAGFNMAGKRTPYLRHPPLNVTRLSGLTTTIIGMVGTMDPEDDCTIVRGESEAWQLMPDAVVCQHSFDVNRLRLMVGEDRILGAVLIGDQTLSALLERLIIQKINISAITKELQQSGAPLADILLNFWEDLRANENQKY